MLLYNLFIWFSVRDRNYLYYVFFIAFVGYIDHYCEDFGEQLESLRKEKRFVGIRARNQGPTDYTDLRGQANS